MKKKIIGNLLVVVLVLSMTACGSKKEKTVETANVTASPQAVETATPAVTVAPAATPSETEGTTDTIESVDGTQNPQSLQYNVTVCVGNSQWKAVLAKNAATDALVKKMPLTISMNELNGNEKFHYFTEKFVTDAQKPGTIHTGDIMLYGSTCLVLFYQDFNTTYAYTKLGNISDVTGLADALGKGTVSVTLKAE